MNEHITRLEKEKAELEQKLEVLSENDAMPRELYTKMLIVKCFKCGKEGNTEWHHINPRHYNFSSDYVVPLCPDCHLQIHGFYRNSSVAHEEIINVERKLSDLQNNYQKYAEITMLLSYLKLFEKWLGKTKQEERE